MPEQDAITFEATAESLPVEPLGIITAPDAEDPDGSARLEQFQFDIASGMLESLGLNMYTSIGKSLSEFVANAYDAEASNIWIEIPFQEIVTERAALRERAKQEVTDNTREKFTVLSDPLPDSVKIVITDDGHGMSPKGIQEKFLIINRNRRSSSAKSETGLRDVMGRKGLGKTCGLRHRRENYHLVEACWRKLRHRVHYGLW